MYTILAFLSPKVLMSCVRLKLHISYLNDFFRCWRRAEGTKDFSGVPGMGKHPRIPLFVGSLGSTVLLKRKVLESPHLYYL